MEHEDSAMHTGIAMVFLTPEELAELTGRRRSDAQAAALRSMGIEHLRRPDGRIVVSRAHVDAMLGVAAPSAKVKDFALDLSTVG